MTDWPAILFSALVSGAVAYLVGWGPPAAVRAPSAVNYRGRSVPVVLGIALTAAVLAGLVVRLRSPAPFADLELLWLVVAILVVFGAGLYDDRQRAGTRGLLAHLGALRRRRVTPGIVKLVAIVGAAGLWVWVTEDPVPGAALAVVLLAGAANLWNLLDVAPGRSLKYGIAAGLVLFGVRPEPFAAAVLVAAVVLLPLDVREMAMLGDSGANVLGFVLGIALLGRLSTPWVLVVAAIVVALHAVSETVTLSRVIRALPPLRWFDDLGRVREPDEKAG